MSDQSTADAPKGPKPPKGRSPSYPGIALATAVGRAETIYKEFGQYPVDLATITSRWDYKSPTTGPASVTYAALKKFGLLDETGKGKERTAKVSDLAVEILNPNPKQGEALARAALKPQIIKDWWGKYKLEPPPWESLRWEYVVKGEPPFTESGLREFVRIYRETVTHAHLDQHGTVARDDTEPEGNDGDDGDDDQNDDDPPPSLRNRLRPPFRNPPERRVVSDATTFAVPIAVGANPIVIEGDFPLSEAEWDQFILVLNAMKPGLVGERPTGPSPESD